MIFTKDRLLRYTKITLAEAIITLNDKNAILQRDNKELNRENNLIKKYKEKNK